MQMRITRTYLAVPAHQKHMVESASSLTVDAVFLDLEDAVPEAQKDAALEGAIEAINTLDWGTKTVCVRVNVPSSARIANEIVQLLSAAPRLDTLLIPKVESVDEIRRIETMVEPATPGRRHPPGLEVMIETARGLVNCEAIAGASRYIESLHFGVGDFSASIGAKGVEIGLSHPTYQLTSRTEDASYSRTPLDMWAYPMMRILVAARAFGLRAIDGPCGAFRDAVLSRDLALKAAAMGFDGKQVIHPLQIDATRSAFMPTDREISQAQRVLEAISSAEQEGKGAVQVDGKLVDYANVRMAQRIIGLAEAG